ncbi:MAG: GNAT family N-acetyltransferase [Saccharofermentanales bacterium]|jgi:ElaA protein|nr:GNAT family N-acetyltransferase [Clostridiaceae bacterium]
MQDEIISQCRPFSALSNEDLYELLRLRSQVFVVEQNINYQDLDGQDTAAHHLLLKTPENVVIAYCRLLPPGTACRETKIGRVVVDRTWRGRGIARKLMQQALSWCRALYPGVEIRISAQKHLKGFYAQYGFQVCTGDYLEEGILHVGMIRPADDPSAGYGIRLRIRYLGHSAYLVTTPKRCLLFDYGSHPDRPAAGSLSSGIFNTDELPDLPLYCFASHQHRDHYSPELHRAMAKRPGTNFILGLDEEPDCAATELSSGRTTFAWPHRIFQLDDLTICCSGSTDSGVSFMVRAPEAVIYHGGDLAVWDDQEFYQRVYREEIDWLLQAGWLPDLAMLPVSTSDGYQEEPLLSGLWFCLKKMKPAVILPMHGAGYEHLYRRFADLAGNYSQGEIFVPTVAGDLFFFDR